jgi:hypothetical protein
MALRDPVAVYDAASNVEAALLRNALVEAGVEAYVTEDLTQVVTGFGIPDLYRPQVWVDKSEVERAVPILADYEQRTQEHHEAAASGPPIDVVCEECGKRSEFPASQRVTIQDCPHCGAYVDVGQTEDWEENPGATEE